MPLEWIIILFILGTCFGSFSTVLIERWHSGKGGILLGRSECPKCHHELHWYELIPLFSWIFQGGKCKECKIDIPTFYPLSELFLGAIFVLGGFILFHGDFSLFSIMSMVLLFWIFITGVYIVYDLRYMEIPDQIMIPALWSVIIVILLGYIRSDWVFFFDSMTYHTYRDLIRDHLSGAIILYIFFALQIALPAGWFFWKKGKIKNILFLLGELLVFPILLLIGKTEETNTEEYIPTWIGGGDLRVALFIGLTLGTIHGISTLFFAYIIGSVISLILILRDAQSGKKLRREIPFGPFLGAGWFLSLFLHSEILMYVNSMSY